MTTAKKTTTQTEPNDQNGNFRKPSNLVLPLTATNQYLIYNNQRSENPTLRAYLRDKLHCRCVKKTLLKRVPILRWLPEYDSNCAVGDLVAGVTVGLTVIPQALANASVAGLPLQYGLYSSFLGCFVYIIFGSCKDVAMGPSAISALLTFQALQGKGPEHAILLCFVTGVIQLLMGFLGLGFLIDFISGPVSSGYTSAAALIIVSTQIKDFLGINVKGGTFVDYWTDIVKDIGNTRLWDSVVGVACLVILLMLRVLSQVKIGPSNPQVSPTKIQKITNIILKIICISRNAILVVTCGAIGYFFCLHGNPPFKVIGYVPGGFPSVQPPKFGYTTIINGTTNFENFLEMIHDLRSAIIIVPLFGFLEDIAVCKAFANGKPVDATQELIAVGLSNLANSFVQAFPGTGALSRSAVNNSSGVKTTLGGLYTGIIVIAALIFFTPYFYYIPKATLSAVIIAAAIFMVEVRVVKPMWKTKKSDLVLGLITFVACLGLKLEYGIAIGVIINLMFILYYAARPKVSIERLKSPEGVDYLLLTPDRCLIFPSAAYVRNIVIKQSIRQAIPVVIDCSHIYGADYTAATVIESLTKDFKARNQPLFFYNLKPSVSSVFVGLNLDHFLVFYNNEELDDMLKKWTTDGP